MMLSLNDKISNRQMQVLLILDLLGTGVIVLPRRTAELAGQDGWALVMGAAALAMACAFVIASVGRMFPNKSFLSYSSAIVSKPVAIILSLGFIFKIVVTMAMELRFFTEIIKQTMLVNTPPLAIYIGLLGVSGYAAAKGVETRARIAEVLLPIVLLPLAVVFALAAADMDFSNLLPVLRSNSRNLGIGSAASLISFTGIEFVLLIFPYLQRPETARKSAVAAIALIGCLMAVLTVITIAKFGPLDVKRQMWPVLEMMDTIDMPGAFIERQDALIISFWIVSVFSIISAGLFFSAILLKDVFKKGRHSMYIFLCIIASALIAAMPGSMADVNAVLGVLFKTLGVAYMFVIPLLLLCVAKARGLGKR